MASGEQKIIQYLQEAHAMEQALIGVLASQIAMAPRGTYKNILETHLQETKDHCRRVQQRLAQLRGPGGPLQLGMDLVQAAVGQAVAFGKLPLDLVRGSGGEEKALKNAKDACATEALEIATYTAIELLADTVGDSETAALAASIRADEQRMLERLLREVPKLTGAVVGAPVRGELTWHLSSNGAAARPRPAARKARANTGNRPAGPDRRPGVAKGAGAAPAVRAGANGKLPIAKYDELTAEQICERLSGLSQAELASVASHERRHDARSTVLERIASLRAREPWPGYDELSVEEIASGLASAGEARVKRVRAYEQAHKRRAGVLDATAREPARA